MAIPCWCSDRTPSDGRASSRTRRANRTPTRRFGRSRRIAVAAFSSESSWLHGRPARRAAQEREEYPPVSSGPDFVVTGLFHEPGQGRGEPPTRHAAFRASRRCSGRRLQQSSATRAASLRPARLALRMLMYCRRDRENS